jgi:hypothetical protein
MWSGPASAQASSVSSESVNDACAPISPRVSGRSFRAVAVARLVAEDGADAQRLERVGDDVERPVDRVGRGVVVDQRRRPPQHRLHPADERRGADRLLVERTVEPPPHPLQDLEEVARRLERVRHAASERRIEMRVGADVAREHESAAGIDALALAGLGDPAVRHPKFPLVQPQRIERANDHSPPAFTSFGTAARAAGESFIGSSVRWMPSNASSAPRTAEAVGTRAASPIPFAPNGPSG